MAKKTPTIEVPGEAPADSPVVPGEDPATTIDPDDETLVDLTALVPAEEVQPPLIERPIGNVPDAADVDPGKINGMVLTKQGWVIPDTSTARAAN